jgi:hypothetical protein
VDGADGILGIGPDKLSVYNNPDGKVIPTLVTTMFEQGIIDHNVFSVYFQPISQTITGLREQKRINGEIVFGGGKLMNIFFHKTMIDFVFIS